MGGEVASVSLRSALSLSSTTHIGLPFFFISLKSIKDLTALLFGISNFCRVPLELPASVKSMGLRSCEVLEAEEPTALSLAEPELKLDPEAAGEVEEEDSPSASPAEAPTGHALPTETEEWRLREDRL